MARTRCQALICLAALFWWSSGSSSSAHSSSALHYVHQYGRELIELPTSGSTEEGLVWVVQLSDLHFSFYHPHRSLSFKKLIPSLLSLVNPGLVVITGDLTDGKSKDRAKMQQDESEWLQYREAVDWVISESGLPRFSFFDVRGNHDKFGVPEPGGSLDYFSKYSISASQNRSSTVQSVTLSNGSWKHLFIVLDNSMEVGLRGPCNLFGHATDKCLDLLDEELSQWDMHDANVTKLVFGHFTTSFIARTKSGRRPEEIFAKHNILAYVCGHLHYQFGQNLLKHHILGASDSKGEFWEWEMGDWKENRVIRLIVIDHGHASFLDIDLDLDLDSVDNDILNSKAFILIAYPLDSRKMQRETPLPYANVEDSVRALVFSRLPIVSAKALVYDTSFHAPVEEIELELLSQSSDSVHYFGGRINMSKYYDSSLTRFSLKIVAFSASGKQIESARRPFSVGGHLGKLTWTWKEFSVMGVVWDELYRPLLWAAFGILFLVLIAPKLYVYLMMVKGRNSSSITRKDFLKEILAQSYKTMATLWWLQLFLLVYLMWLPWFWGSVLGDGHPAGSMSVRGWLVSIAVSPDMKQGLGVPDIIVIVLPYLFHILLPVFCLGFALSAEHAMAQLHALALIDSLSEKKFMASSKSTAHIASCKVCRRWLRKALLVACLGVACLHAQVASLIILSAYFFY